MKCSRWIATCVDMFDHPLVGMAVPPPKAADPSKHAQAPAIAWLDMIASAAWQERRIPHKGAVINLKRGQLLAGRSYWATRWNWGEKSVRSFFTRLEEHGMIEFSGQSNGHYANTVSVCKYDKYQSKQEAEKPEVGPVVGQSPASGGPVVGQTLTKDTNIPVSEVVVDSSAPQKSKPLPRGARLDANWELPNDWYQWARVTFPATSAEAVRMEAENFADYWHAKAGKDACKLDWEATWRGWCRRSLSRGPMRPGAFRGQSAKQEPTYRPSMSQIAQALQELEEERAI